MDLCCVFVIILSCIMDVFNVYLYVTGPVLDELNVYLKKRGWWFFHTPERATDIKQVGIIGCMYKLPST